MKPAENNEVKELKQSVKKLPALIDEAPVGICYVDLKGKITYVNKRFEEVSGYSREEVVGKNGFKLGIFSNETIKLLAKRMKDRLTGRPPRLLEIQFKCKDGHWIWVAIEGKIIREGGIPVGFQLTSRDITERKQAEEALRESEEKYRTLVEDAPIGVFNVDLKGKITYVNQRFEEVSGYSREEVVGKSGLKLGLVSNETIKLLLRRMKERLMGRPLRTLEIQFKCKDGHWIWVMIEGRIIREGGIPVGFQLVSRDITERKRAEEALQESEEKYRTLVEDALVGIMHVDITGKITYVNKTILEATGYSWEEMVGKNAFRLGLVSNETAKVLGKRLKEKLMGQPPGLLEMQYRRKDGEWIWLQIRGKVLRKNNVPVGIQIVGDEITKRKQAEEALQAEKNKLQSLIGAMEDCLTIQDKDYNILYQNKPTKILFGEHVGEKCYRVYEGSERVCAGCPVEKAFKDGRSHTSERRVVLPSGEVTFWENMANPIRDASGRITSCLEVTRNITGRRQVEEELRLRAQILDSATDSILLHDFDGNLIYVNEAACRAHGSSREEFMKMKLNQIVAPEQARHLESNFKEILEKGEVIFESAHLSKAGPTVPIEVHGRTIESGGRKLFLAVARDITERKKAEEALQAEKNKLQSLTDAMEDNLTIRDIDYNLIYQNEPSRKIHGDCLGEKCYRAIEGRDELCDECPVEEAFKDGKSHTSERRVVLPSGEVLFWENTANPIKDASGRIVSCLEIGRNITERRQMEEELKESQEFNFSLLENAPNPIEVINPDTSIRYVNPAFERLTGFTLAEVVGIKPPYPWWPEESKKELPASLKEDMAGESRRRERIYQNKNGERFWAVLSTAPVMLNGKLRYFLLNWLDITERKQAEEALRGSEQRYRTLFENTLDGVFVIDAETMKVVLANKAAANLFGFDSAEDVIGASPLDFVPPDDRGRVIKIIGEDMFVKDLRQTNEFRAITRDGREIWIRAVGVRTEYQGRLAGLVSFSDITGRRQAEEALRESREQLRKMFESVADGISVVDLNGVITDANQKAVELHGFASREELLGKTAFELVTPCDHERIAKNMQQALKQGTLRDVEYTLLKADGTEFPGELSTSMLKDASGKAVGHITIARDITERKRMEQALRESEEKFSKAFRSSPTDAVTITRLRDGLLLDVNDNFLHDTGYTREEVINHASTELGIWAKAEDRARMVQILKKEGRVHNEEFAFRMKSGEIRETLFSAELIDIGGEPCVISMTINISGLRKTERALERQEAYFQQLFDNSPDAIGWMDTADRFVSVNKGFETLFGYGAEELKGRFINDTIVPEDRIDEASALSRARFSNKAVRKETVRKRKDGSLVDVSIIGYPIRFGNETVGAYAIYTDITGRKRAEEKEKQLQRELYLAQRLASVGELAAGVAHEINNPLTGVLGFSQRLMRKSTSEEFSRDLEIIHSEAQRAAKIVQSLLAFARRREPKKEYSDINDIVQRTLELRGYALQTGNIEVTTSLAPDLPQIMVDFHQIQEVFLNIILNAEQAINEANGGGTLTIKTREIKDYVRISFADNGPGIPPEQLDKVFDPFFTTRADRGGTGLGLSACHGTVTEHGGRIYARSKPGKGATFFIELPLSPIEATVGRRV